MYTVISNPLLPSENKTSLGRSLSQKVAHQWSGSRIRQIISSTKRVVPSPLVNDHPAKPTPIQLSKEKTPDLIDKPTGCADFSLATQGPDVYYNGNIDTLDQLPRDRLAWIFQPSPVEDQLSQWKDPHSIVLRKPNRSKDVSLSSSVTSFPMAMAYMRVVDVVKSSSSKACSFYCQVQTQEQVYTGRSRSCVKYEKQSSQADIDEVYLLDLNHAEKVTVRLYMQTKSFVLNGGRKRTREVCLGQQVLSFKLRPMKKQVNRMTFHHGEDIYQVMLIHGTFMTERAQSLVSNQALHADYLTIYLRGGTIPRWQRYWGVLHATYLVLYDFEYKKSKPPKEVIPFHALESVFHPSTQDEEEQMVDVGRLGLALQFTPDPRHRSSEHRMYILPDNDRSGQQWEASLRYGVSLVEEFRSPTMTQQHESIPTKYLW